MPDEPPTPPTELPPAMIDDLNAAAPERLRAVARYAETLAEYKERNAQTATESDSDEPEDQIKDLPEGVPSKATVTIKEINDNRYYYWQWRAGDKIKSKYKAPVDADE